MVCARWNRVSILDSIALNCEAMASSDCFVVVAVSLHSVRMCLYLHQKEISDQKRSTGMLAWGVIEGCHISREEWSCVKQSSSRPDMRCSNSPTSDSILPNTTTSCSMLTAQTQTQTGLTML